MMVAGEITGFEGNAEGVSPLRVNLSGKRTAIGRNSGENPGSGITQGANLHVVYMDVMAADAG
jgi:hypothetical protein